MEPDESEMRTPRNSGDALEGFGLAAGEIGEGDDDGEDDDADAEELIGGAGGVGGEDRDVDIAALGGHGDELQESQQIVGEDGDDDDEAAAGEVIEEGEADGR